MMFTGTNQQQDTRFSDKEKKLMKQMKFGDCLNKRVDMSKVKLDVLRPWISKKITDILHIEDDVVVEFVYNQLEEEKYPCPKKMQINMTGFLNGKNARQFMGELWTLLLSAQESESGIPAEFIQQKKDEILRREEELRQEQLTKRDRSRTPFEKDRDREKDRGSRRDRSGRDRSKERAIHPDMPASTLTAIEQVRCQLKSRSNSTETNNLSNVAVKNNSTENAARNRSKSPKAKAAENVAKSRNRSRSRDRRHSRDRSSQRASGERNSPPSRRRTSRDRDRRRSPKRRSVDRKRRSSRSRDRSSRQFHSSNRRSRSHSPQKRSDNVNTNTSSRSIERRSKSASPGKRKQSPKSEARKCSPTPVVAKPGVNGIDTADSTSEKKLTKVQGKLFELAAGTAKTKSRSRSRSRSRHASPTTDKKMKNSKSRSRSLPKKRLRERSSSHRTSSSCRSSPASGHKKKLSRSVSRGSRSPTHSPENRRDDFEITKSKNSVQKKRHYRNNRNSSSGSSVDRTMDDRIGEKRRDGYRRASPRGRSPQNRNQRSRSGRRSRSRSRSRSRMRNRSRSPMRRSRSPRRFNRRWSPNFHHFRGRGGLNRGRMNHWRRSHSRGRGRNMSPQRRFSPQRRYSRDRRSPQMQMQYRDRKFSPARRYSPQPQARRSRERRPSSRDRRPASRDRRPSSPIREFSRERRMSRERRRPSPLYVADFGGRGKPKTDNRWEMSSARGGQKPKQRVSSESSNWEESDQEEIKNKGSPKKSSPAPSRSASPIKSTERREKSKSRSQERHKKMSSPAPKALVGKDKSSTTERSSIEYSDTVVKTTDLSKQEKDDYKRKTKSDTLPEIMSKQPSLIIDQQQLEPCRSKEVSRAKYSLSLSRTPSPFLKPHEREKAGQVAVTHKKHFEKKTEVIPKTNVRDTESSSSDSSDSDDSDEEEKTVFPKKTEMRASKSRKFSDSDRSVGEKKVPMKGKRAEHKTAKRDGNSHKNSVDTRAKPDNSSASRAAKVLETSTSSDPMDRSVPSTELKKCMEERRRIVSSVDTDYDGKTKPNEKASRKRTLSISDVRKQDHNTTDSDYDQALKKKRKKNKKIVKRNSDNDSSESEGEIKKKKHKKHKKHSKKNKKHKKHKKKSKKADNTSSSDEESDNKVAKIEPRGRFPTGINEDLEKQLRERALKSMKKID